MSSKQYSCASSVFGTKTRTVFREFATVKQAFRELEFSAGFRAGDTSLAPGAFSWENHTWWTSDPPTKVTLTGSSRD